jgi:hypothetical protein
MKSFIIGLSVGEIERGIRARVPAQYRSTRRSYEPVPGQKVLRQREKIKLPGGQYPSLNVYTAVFLRRGEVTRPMRCS